MKKKTDIVDIKKAINDGQLTVYVKDGKIYMKNEIGECVQIGEVK